MRAVLQRRHGGRWHMVFCDGHVESGKTADWFDIRKEAVSRHWYRDNLPTHEPGSGAQGRKIVFGAFSHRTGTIKITWGGQR
ncbi:MAG: hypothetical protein HY674_23360, partial [Chloroflexi bacterium]|nr:hypothetical protein [Chloroflexota bacterium]